MHEGTHKAPENPVQRAYRELKARGVLLPKANSFRSPINPEPDDVAAHPLIPSPGFAQQNMKSGEPRGVSPWIGRRIDVSNRLPHQSAG